MVRPDLRRRTVQHLVRAYKVSERRACKALRANRSVIRYQSTSKNQAVLIKRIKDLATIRVRYGYRRISVLLKREGWKVNHKRIYRLYRLSELQMRLKPPRRRVSIQARIGPVIAKKQNECWSMDFVKDELFNGRRLRILTIVDNFTRESIGIFVNLWFKGVDVAKALEKVINV